LVRLRVAGAGDDDHGQQRHILAGEDSPVILNLFRDILEEEGYRVTLSSSPLDLDTVKQIDPDLVIINHMLDEGEGSGWDLLQALKEDDATSVLPVVVCTGAVQKVQAGRALLRDLGALLVLKPFNIDDLIGTINTAWPAPAETTSLDQATCPQRP